jgi:serine/threonine-protein kinase
MALPFLARDQQPADSFVGRVLEGRYRIEARLGEGGLGTVYRAQHLKLARSVAIKVLREDLRSVPQIRARFEREVKALSSLSHPNVVTITDYGISDGIPFLVMELAEGRELAKMIAEITTPVRALSIVRQILASLAYAHARDVVHRDLKPANVIVRQLPDGRDHVVVLDFGLAKFVGEDSGAELTRSGLVVGTPAYMPPEQMAAGAKKADARSDLYSAGLILFELLTGRRPFLFDEPAELLRAHLVTPPPTLAEALPGSKVEPALEAVITKALAKAPDDRFKTAKAMIEAIDALPIEPMLRPGARSSKTATGTQKTSTKTLVSRPNMPARDAIAFWVFRILIVMAVFFGTAFGITLLAATPPAETVAQAETGQTAPDRTATPTTGTPPSRVEGLPDVTAHPEGAPLTTATPQVAQIQAVEVPPEPAPPEPAAPTMAEQVAAAAAEAQAMAEEGLAEVPSPIPAAAPEAGAERPRARNPLRGRLPALLSRARGRLQRGQELSRGEMEALARYRNEHSTDVRVRLLLGHAYAERGWLSATLDQYDRVIAMDAGARGDHMMLNNVIRIARTDTLSARAADFLVRVYGSEAREAVMRAKERTRDEEERARLGAILTRL